MGKSRDFREEFESEMPEAAHHVPGHNETIVPGKRDTPGQKDIEDWAKGQKEIEINDGTPVGKFGPGNSKQAVVEDNRRENLEKKVEEGEKAIEEAKKEAEKVTETPKKKDTRDWSNHRQTKSQDMSWGEIFRMGSCMRNDSMFVDGPNPASPLERTVQCGWTAGVDLLDDDGTPIRKKIYQYD